MRFFDSYERFYDTSGTRRIPNRFHQRWRMIVEQNAQLFAGARVLDLASHDGRWSFAALKAGAAFVEGVEGREELISRATANFAHYGVSASSYRFVCGDAVRHLASDPGRFDLVLNLGFFYHTMKHLEILEHMARTEARAFIIDTQVAMTEAPIISVAREDPGSLMLAIDHLDAGAALVPVGTPSRAAVAMMLDYVGYDCVETDWRALVEDFEGCDTYRTGQRTTFVAHRRARPDRVKR
jgi:hypothetical protein